MRLTRSLTLALFCTLGAGCLGDPNIQPPTPWRARATPVNGSTVNATVDAVSQGRNETQAGLNAVAAPETKYGWQINEGSCASPGPLLGGRGAYPDFTTNAEGRGVINETFITALMIRGNPYHAVIVDPVNRSAILACGDFNTLTF